MAIDNRVRFTADLGTELHKQRNIWLAVMSAVDTDTSIGSGEVTYFFPPSYGKFGF